MSSLKNIREKFGISQQQVAHWLGISRSLAAHYERGIRSLPTHALLQLAKLEIVLAEFEKNVSGDTKHSDDLPVADDGSLSLDPKLAFQLYKVKMLQQQLFVLQSRHAVLQQQMLLVKKMMDSCNGQTGEKEKLWLQMLYHGLCCKISKFDESKQLPLRGKILEMRRKKNN